MLVITGYLCYTIDMYETPDFDQQALLGDVPSIEMKLQAHRDFATLLEPKVQTGEVTELEADAALYDFQTYLFKNRFVPEDEDPVAA